MDEIHVTGKASLSGEIFIQGSKNAALPMIAASLMHRGLSILRGCPRISDVFCMEEILKSLGAVTWWDDHDLYLDCSCADGTEIPAVYTGRMRSSIILAGAVLARNRKCRIGYPGGCTIGKRPIDLHLMALRALGADVRENASGLDGECVRFEGQDIVFPKSSVGAAQQAILAAVLAKGVTHLYNCAKEPEVFWLCRYLKTMGALIEGEETGEITIRGVDELKGGDYRIPPDRIVAGTYLCACQKRECDLAETLEACSSVQVSSFIYICINRLESCNIDQCIKCTSDPQRYCNDSPDRIVGTQNIHTESLDSQSFSKLRNQVCKNIVKDESHDQTPQHIRQEIKRFNRIFEFNLCI